MPDPAPTRIAANDLARVRGKQCGLELVTRDYPGGPYTYAFLWVDGIRYSLGAPVIGYGWPFDHLEAALRRIFAEIRHV